MRPDFGGRAALRTFAIAHQYNLARAQLRHPKTPERLHVNKDVRRPLALRDEAVAAHAVEPFNRRADEQAGGRHGRTLPRGRHLRGMRGSTLVHGDDAEGLQALRAVLHLADDARALIRRLEAVTTQARDVQEHVRHAVVGNDETVTL